VNCRTIGLQSLCLQHSIGGGAPTYTNHTPGLQHAVGGGAPTCTSGGAPIYHVYTSPSFKSPCATDAFMPGATAIKDNKANKAAETPTPEKHSCVGRVAEADHAFTNNPTTITTSAEGMARPPEAQGMASPSEAPTNQVKGMASPSEAPTNQATKNVPMDPRSDSLRPQGPGSGSRQDGEGGTAYDVNHPQDAASADHQDTKATNDAAAGATNGNDPAAGPLVATNDTTGDENTNQPKTLDRDQETRTPTNPRPWIETRSAVSSKTKLQTKPHQPQPRQMHVTATRPLR